MTLGLGLGLNFSPKGAWTPARESGLFLWLEADQGVTLVSGKVSAWADLSGAGNGCAQATPSERPPFVASDASYGGRPILSFANAQVLVGTAPINKVQPVTWYFVGETTGGTQTFVDGQTNRQAVFTISGAWNIYAGTLVAGSAPPTSTPLVLSAVFNGAGSALYQDSSSTPVVSGDAGASSIDTYSLGGYFSGLNLLIGKLGTVLGYSRAHTAGQRARIMQRLAGGYRIAGVS